MKYIAVLHHNGKFGEIAIGDEFEVNSHDVRLLGAANVGILVEVPETAPEVPVSDPEMAPQMASQSTSTAQVESPTEPENVAESMPEVRSEKKETPVERAVAPKPEKGPKQTVRRGGKTVETARSDPKECETR